MPRNDTLLQRALDSPAVRGGISERGDDAMRLRRMPRDSEVLGSFSEYQLDELRHSDQTARGYKQQLLAVARMLDKPIASVTPKDIRYKVKRDTTCAHSTLHLRVTAYRQLHMWALLEEEPWANPAMLGVKAPPGKRRLAKPPLYLHDARKLLAACSCPNDYRTIYLGLYAMTRVEESAKMGPEHFHRDRLTFIGKGDKERTVPVHPELAKVLPLFLDRKPKSKGVLMCRMTKLRDKLKIRDMKGKPATTHSLRRTGADFLYSTAGVEREVVKMLLGHGSEVTDVYAPVRFPKMASAVAKLDYSKGEPIQLRFAI